MLPVWPAGSGGRHVQDPLATSPVRGADRLIIIQGDEACTGRWTWRRFVCQGNEAFRKPGAGCAVAVWTVAAIRVLAVLAQPQGRAAGLGFPAQSAAARPCTSATWTCTPRWF